MLNGTVTGAGGACSLAPFFDVKSKSVERCAEPAVGIRSAPAVSNIAANFIMTRSPLFALWCSSKQAGLVRRAGARDRPKPKPNFFRNLDGASACENFPKRGHSTSNLLRSLKADGCIPRGEMAVSRDTGSHP